jgi:hypothetical protein
MRTGLIRHKRAQIAILRLSALCREARAMIKTFRFAGLFSNGANRDRTGDLLLAKQALSQLSYGPAILNIRSRERISGPERSCLRSTPQ